MTRRVLRRMAFHLVFQMPFHTGLDVESLARLKADYYDSLAEGVDDEPGFLDFTPPKGTHAEYINRVVWGVFESRAELDGVISNFLRDWSIERIGKVDLAVMRLAIYEMLREKDVPLGVAVDEAVEIAKEYGTKESPSFINGVLGNVSGEIKAKGREFIG